MLEWNHCSVGLGKGEATSETETGSETLRDSTDSPFHSVTLFTAQRQATSPRSVMRCSQDTQLEASVIL